MACRPGQRRARSRGQLRAHRSRRASRSIASRRSRARACSGGSAASSSCPTSWSAPFRFCCSSPFRCWPFCSCSSTSARISSTIAWRTSPSRRACSAGRRCSKSSGRRRRSTPTSSSAGSRRLPHGIRACRSRWCPRTQLPKWVSRAGFTGLVDRGTIARAVAVSARQRTARCGRRRSAGRQHDGRGRAGGGGHHAGRATPAIALQHRDVPDLRRLGDRRVGADDASPMSVDVPTLYNWLGGNRRATRT